MQTGADSQKVLETLVTPVVVRAAQSYPTQAQQACGDVVAYAGENPRCRLGQIYQIYQKYVDPQSRSDHAQCFGASIEDDLMDWRDIAVELGVQGETLTHAPSTPRR